MTTKLDLAKGKLARIRGEQETNSKSIREESGRIPLGQPNIIGRPDIYKDINRKHAKAIKLLEEEEKQEMRVEMLEKVEAFKDENELLKDVHVVGKSSYASVGAKTSVNNLDYFRNQLKELEQANEEAKAYNKTKPIRKKATYGAKITKLKNKIATLEKMEEKDKNKVTADRTQELIDSGAVNQWKKKPIYYFVKGLKKVALEINEQGFFEPSRRYPPYSDEDKIFIENLLSGEE